MTKLNLEGREVNNTKEIVQGVENFYQELYNEKEVQISATEEVLNSLERKINTNSEFLTKDFNVLEMTKCMKSFKRGKSPGMDGLPLEFYENFWDILVHESFLKNLTDLTNSLTVLE